MSFGRLTYLTGSKRSFFVRRDATLLAIRYIINVPSGQCCRLPNFACLVVSLNDDIRHDDDDHDEAVAASKLATEPSIGI